MNILYINNKKAQESRCWTEKLGVNQCMIAAKNAVLDKLGVKIEESTVEQREYPKVCVNLQTDVR